MPDSPDFLMKYLIMGDFAGQTTETALWLRSKETATTTDVEAYLNGICDEMEVFMFSSFQACCTAEWQLEQTVIQVLAGSLPYQVVRGFTTKFGTRPTIALPPHDAGLLSLYTPFHGRRNHGRIYLPAQPENEQSLGLFTEVHRSRIDTLGSLLRSRFGETGNSPNCYLTVFSKKNGVTRELLPTPHLVYDVLAAIPISRYVAHREVATQRHRKFGRGI